MSAEFWIFVIFNPFTVLAVVGLFVYPWGVEADKWMPGKE